MREVDELRPLTALGLLSIWRESREAAETELERSLLSNAQVLAECCFFQGEAVFDGREDVLASLTVREMEQLLGRLTGAAGVETVNTAFDQARFDALREG